MSDELIRLSATEAAASFALTVRATMPAH